MRRALSMVMLALLVLSSVPVIAQDYAPAGTPTPTPTETPKQDTTSVYYAYQLSDKKQGVWKATKDEKPADVLTKIQTQYKDQSASILYGNQPIYQTLADFKKQYPGATFTTATFQNQEVNVIEYGSIRVSSYAGAETQIKIGDTWVNYRGPLSSLDVQTAKDGTTTLFFNKEPVRVVLEAGKTYLVVLDDAGKDTDKIYAPIKNGVIRQTKDQYQVLDAEGNVLGTFDIKEWEQFRGNENDLVAVSAQLRNTGLSLNDVTPYKQTVDGEETTVFIYEADFGDDVRVYTTSDGKQVREEGDYTGTTWTSEEKNVYNKDGTLYERTVYEKNGKTIESQYTYGQDTLTIQVQDDKGTLLQPETFTIARDSQGKVVGYEIGTYDSKKKVYYDPISGDYKYADGAEISDEDEKAVKADKNAEKKVDKIDDAEAARRDAEPGRWELAWRQGGLWGLVKEFFAGYEAFRGLGAYGALFWDEEELYERRLEVKKQFCKTVVLGGVDCWTSKLCERYTDQNTGSNTLVTVVPGQAVRAAAHIEAERTETTEFANESGTFGLYLYRVTFFASSPREDNSVQLRFYYDGGTYDWFPEPQQIDAGGVVSASGAAAIVSYGRRDYSRVCLMLSEGIEVGTGSSVSEICAPIVDSGLSPSGVESVPGATEAETPPAAGQPGAGF
ncbi:hypothetical protein HY493_02705 [Candidatus Woesearchaeota archaeon]|nr:hypothetical protein [Candidatus Woesearchaeota archaeon]